MKPRSLLAKSADPRFAFDALTLAGHSLRVETAARALHQTIGSDLALAFGLDSAASERLARLSTLAALLHDVGKATTSFQQTVAGESKERHPWRHEFLSAAAIQSEALLRPWLAAQLGDDELALVSMMIAGHHLRARPDMAHPRVPRDEHVVLGSDDLRVVWEHAARLVGTETLPSIADLRLEPDNGSSLVQDYIMAARQSDRQRDRRSPILPVGKALVIAADIVASAHAGSDPIDSWVADALVGGLSEDALDAVITSRLGGREPRDFQNRVASSDDAVTVVTAGCGNGKTLAAYLWARRHAVGRRLAFCYPTTGTATAGFADYLLAQTDLERRLLHSRARVDVESFEQSPDDDEPMELWARDVLERWSAHVVACTADTVLGLMTNWRTALASLPLWAKCVFVFDEVHSYDRALFGALLAFLGVVRAPVLLMTASLSPARREALANALGRPIDVIDGDPDIEKTPRYRLTSTDRTAALENTVAAVRRGQKVLWVANRVAAAQADYRDLRAVLGADVCRVYHSRFRYEDRVHRQADVIARFGGEAGMVVVATQVCEMSLDISADLLVTELAPLPSLVQRLGRLNRRDPVPSATKDCLWFEPEKAAPYLARELDASRSVMAHLEGTGLSQRDLADALAGLEEPPYETRSTPFSEQTWMTFPGPLRENTPSWTIVRRSDLPASLQAVRRVDVIRGAIEMPPGADEVPDWPVVYGAFVVPDDAVRYSTEEGATWAI